MIRSFRRALPLAAAILLSAAGSSALAQDEIFAANANNYVVVQSRIAAGNVAPVRVLTGNATGLAGPFGIAVDTVHNELFVSNASTAGSVTVYPRLALGNTPPTRTITGPATGLAVPGGLALDLVNNEIFVANRGSAKQTVTVYSRTDSGNVAPSRTIGGSNTGFTNPEGVSLDLTNNELYVVNAVPDAVEVFDRTASGNVAPKRVLSGPSTGLNGPRFAVPDATHNELFVSNQDGNSVTVYTRTASGNAAPMRTIAGANTMMSDPRGLFVNLVNDELVVANSLVGSLVTFARGADGNATPLRAISGDATFLAALAGVAVTTSLPAGLTTVTPCRVADTRNAPGAYGGPALTPFSDRSFTISGKCGIPEGARAVAFNFTVTQPTGAGDLRVFPGAVTPPIVSTLNWRPGQTRANNAVIQLGTSGDITVRVDQDGGSVHFIVDVTGYFR